jgi:hypothetical protein
MVYVYEIRNTKVTPQVRIDIETEAKTWAIHNGICFHHNDANGISLLMLKGDTEAIAFHLMFGEKMRLCFKQDASEMVKFNYGAAFNNWIQQ